MPGWMSFKRAFCGFGRSSHLSKKAGWSSAKLKLRKKEFGLRRAEIWQAYFLVSLGAITIPGFTGAAKFNEGLGFA
jgi:hypothetical protein